MFGRSTTSSGFGGFGSNSGSTFGASNTGFGATSSPQSNSIFGASNNTNNNNNTPAFGGSSGGAFGANTASGGLFGASTATNTSPFGASAPTTTNNTGFGSAFGSNTTNNASSGGMFGAKPATTGFGMGTNTQASSPFGSTMNTGFGGLGAAAGGQNQGTAIKPYEAFTEKDATSGQNIYENICCMPEYKNFSFEELRMVDYEQGRRFGNGQATGGFGAAASSPFGATNTNNTGSAFGGGAFGSTNNNTSGGLFGSTNNNNTATTSGFGSAFGSNNTNTAPSGGMFGSNNNTSAFGSNNNTGSGFGSTFGANNNNNNNNNTTSAFGASNNNAAGGLFGASNSASSPFGSNNNNTASGGLFGNNNTTSNTSPFGANNSNTNAGGLFGSNNNTTSAFGAQNNNASGGLFGSTNTTNNAFGANTSPFGANNNTNQAKPGFGSAFGSNNNANTGSAFGGFGATTTTNNNNNNNTGGGLFGNSNATNATSGGLFGNPSTPANNSTTNVFGAKPASGGGLFGANNTASTGGMFGNNTNTANTSGGLFGNNNANNNASGGLFGAKPAATTGFGAPAPAAGGLFGAKPAGTTGFGATGATTGGGLFGNNNASTTSTGFGAASAPATSGGLFGNNNASTTGSTGFGSGGGLFGAKPAATTGGFGSTAPSTGGLFGGSNTTSQQPATGGLFGGGAASTQQKPSLFGGLSDSSTTASTGGLFGASQAQQPATGGLFGGQQQQQQQQMQQMQQQPGQSYQLVATIDQNPYGNNPLFQGSSLSITLNVSPPVEPLAKPVVAEVKQPNLSSAYRMAPKPLFSASGEKKSIVAIAGGDSPKPVKAITDSSGANKALLFNIATDDAILQDFAFGNGMKMNKKVFSTPVRKSIELENESEMKKNQNDGEESEVMPENPASTVKESHKPSIPREEDLTVVDEDGYWMSPSLEELEQMSLLDLRKVHGLTVGRKGYGKIEFSGDVDLTTVSSLAAIPGELIMFLKQSFVVYPNDAEKPTRVGEGLNAPATITLEGCYPIAKDTRKPVKDVSHKLYKKHLERLQKIPNTKFVSYDNKTGDWTFTVEKTVG